MDKTKAQIKAFFETGDTPTEAQFIDLIDSYVDKSGPLGQIETAASGGVTGIAFCSGGVGEIIGAAQGRNFLGITVYTTAGVEAVIGGSVFGTAAAIAACSGVYTTTAEASAAANDAIAARIATTAQASAQTSNTVLMTPILVKKATEIKASDFTGLPAETIATADSIMFSDATDNGNPKQSTVQGILDLRPPTTQNTVGSYAFARKLTGDIAFGGTISGSNLEPAGFNFTTSTWVFSGGTLTGTWRCMGYATGSTATDDIVTLWVRVS